MGRGAMAVLAKTATFVALLATFTPCFAQVEESCDDAAALLQTPHGHSHAKPSPLGLTLVDAIRKHRITTGTFIGMACASLMFLAWEFTWGSNKYHQDCESAGISDRWWLIIMSAMVQVVSGSVYAMGAWQNDLRDALQISMTGATVISAMTFMGNVAGLVGGMIFDLYGPKAAICLGSCLLSIGYCLIGIALIGGLSSELKLVLASLGSLVAGYSSVSLLDNITCMACSLSFPKNRAAVVGYLKAVLATAGGLWALLWVQVFRDQYGLVAFVAVSAIAAFVVGVISISSIKVLPTSGKDVFKDRGDFARAFACLFLLTVLTCFDVTSGYRYAKGIVPDGVRTGGVALALQMSPLLLLFTVKGQQEEGVENLTSAHSKRGLSFKTAFVGMDFWLLWLCQFAVFGAGVATNQNLALILETTGHDSASSLGVALFALTSALSRVVVGILSDKYQAYFSRFHWLTAGAICAMTGQFLVSLMDLTGILAGTLLMGLSFGSFYTIIVPIVNEMYGNLDFGKMWGAQMSSQAAAALIIVCQLMPVVYRNAAGGKDVCIGPACYRPSFLLLTVLNAVGLAAAMTLQVRNADSLPVTRVKEVANPEES